MNADIIEFSLYSAENPNGYDDAPEFERECWPKIRGQGDTIGRVVVPGQGIRRAVYLREAIERGTVLGEGVVAIGRTTELDGRSLEDVKILAEAFDLAVYFEVSADSTVASQLLGVWQRPGELHEDACTLGLSEREARQLTVVAEAHGAGNIAVAFRSEGTAMIVVAPIGLRALQKNVGTPLV